MWYVAGYFAIAAVTGAVLIGVVLGPDNEDKVSDSRCIGIMLLGLLWPLVWFVVPVLVAGIWLASRKKL